MAASSAPAKPENIHKRLTVMLRESTVVLVLPIALYLFACFWSYHPADPGWSNAGDSDVVHNLGGRAGAFMADLGLYLVGRLVYLLPIALMYFALRIARPGAPARDPALGALHKAGGLLLTLVAGAVLVGCTPPTPEQAAWRHVTGTFRAFAEWASDENLALARKGMREARDTPFHDLDATAIAEGSAAFTTIKEWFDAR